LQEKNRENRKSAAERFLRTSPAFDNGRMGEGDGNDSTILWHEHAMSGGIRLFVQAA
jgi:hypothetical protein